VSSIRALVALEKGVEPDTVREALPPGGVEVLQWLDSASAQQAGDLRQQIADLQNQMAALRNELAALRAQAVAARVD